MLRLIIGAILGAMGMYAYATMPKKKRKALTDGIRLPKPATSVDLPVDNEDIELIDRLICECARTVTPPIEGQVRAVTEQEAYIKALTLCTASAIYASEEIPWPPVPGDHPTIHQLWGILGYRIRRLILRNELEALCPSPELGPMGFRPPDFPGQ